MVVRECSILTKHTPEDFFSMLEAEVIEARMHFLVEVIMRRISSGIGSVSVCMSRRLVVPGGSICWLLATSVYVYVTVVPRTQGLVAKTLKRLSQSLEALSRFVSFIGVLVWVPLKCFPPVCFLHFLCRCCLWYVQYCIIITFVPIPFVRHFCLSKCSW